MVVTITRPTDFQDVRLPNSRLFEQGLVQARTSRNESIRVDITQTPSSDTDIFMREIRYNGSAPLRSKNVTRPAGYTNIVRDTSTRRKHWTFPSTSNFLATDNLYAYQLVYSGGRIQITRYDIQTGNNPVTVYLPPSTRLTGQELMGVGGEYVFLLVNDRVNVFNANEFVDNPNGVVSLRGFVNLASSRFFSFISATYFNGLYYLAGESIRGFSRRPVIFEYDNETRIREISLPVGSSLIGLRVDDDFFRMSDALVRRSDNRRVGSFSSNSEIISNRMWHPWWDGTRFMASVPLTFTPSRAPRQVQTIPFDVPRQGSNRNTVIYAFREVKANASARINDSYTATLSDTTGSESFVDTWDLGGMQTVTAQDRVRVRDTASTGKQAVREAGDSVKVEERVSTGGERIRAASDTYDISDRVSTAKSAPDAISAVDTVEVGETVSRDKALTVSDTLRIRDRVSAIIRRALSAVDTYKFREIVSRLRATAVSVRDTLTFSDSVNLRSGFGIRVTRSTDFQDIGVPNERMLVDQQIIQAARDSTGGLTVDITRTTPSPDTEIFMREWRYRGSTPNRAKSITITTGRTSATGGSTRTNLFTIPGSGDIQTAVDDFYVYAYEPRAGGGTQLTRYLHRGTMDGRVRLPFPSLTEVRFIGVAGDYAFFIRRVEGVLRVQSVDINALDTLPLDGNAALGDFFFTTLAFFSGVCNHNGRFFFSLVSNVGSSTTLFNRLLYEYDSQSLVRLVRSERFSRFSAATRVFGTGVDVDEDFYYTREGVYRRDNGVYAGDIVSAGHGSIRIKRGTNVITCVDGRSVYTLNMNYRGGRQIPTIPFTTPLELTGRLREIYVFRETKANAKAFQNDGYTVTITDGIGSTTLTDSWNLIAEKAAEPITDPIRVRDTVSLRKLDVVHRITDALTLRDTVTAQALDKFRTIADRVKVEEIVSKTKEVIVSEISRFIDRADVIRDTAIEANDGFGIRDTVNDERQTFLSASEIIRITETVSQDKAREISETVGFTDVAALVVIKNRVIKEAVRVSDVAAISGFRNFIEQIAERVEVFDRASRGTTEGLADDIAIAEVIRTAQDRTEEITDALKISDTAAKLRYAIREISDNYEIRDMAVRISNRVREITDALDLADRVGRDTARIAISRMAVRDFAVAGINRIGDIVDTLRIRDTARKIHRRLAGTGDISSQRMSWHLLRMRGREDGTHLT